MPSIVHDSPAASSVAQSAFSGSEENLVQSSSSGQGDVFVAGGSEVRYPVHPGVLAGLLPPGPGPGRRRDIARCQLISTYRDSEPRTRNARVIEQAHMRVLCGSDSMLITRGVSPCFAVIAKSRNDDGELNVAMAHWDGTTPATALVENLKSATRDGDRDPVKFAVIGGEPSSRRECLELQKALPRATRFIFNPARVRGRVPQHDSWSGVTVWVRPNGKIGWTES
jgi:hypothetical protein